MNQNYFSRQNFNTSMPFIGNLPPSNQSIMNTTETELPMEQSYIENILRLNKGKKVEIYATYADATEWRDKVFKGIVEQAGRDHIILSDPTTGEWYLILMIYVDYIKFDEKINYSPEFIPS